MGLFAGMEIVGEDDENPSSADTVMRPDFSIEFLVLTRSYRSLFYNHDNV